MANQELAYISFDPGLATGWAMWDEGGDFIDMSTVWDYDELCRFFENLPTIPSTIIYEVFTLDPNVPQGGSDMPAAIATGIIYAHAHINRCEIVKQPSSIKTVAEKWGVSTKGISHRNTHVLDAYNHGVYYFIQNGMKQIDLRGLKL
jgi:hypothetical protein